MNKKILLAISVIALVFGMMLVGCGNGTTGDDGGPDIGLNGVWEDSNGIKITVSGNRGVWTSFPTYPDDLTQSSIDKGYIKIGGQFWRNLTSTGNLTWSGEQAVATGNSSNPSVATGSSWTDRTFTMNADGKHYGWYGLVPALVLHGQSDSNGNGAMHQN